MIFDGCRNMVHSKAKSLLLLVIVVMMAAFVGTVRGEEKPFAPESIDDVVIVTAEEAVELILQNPDMPIIDSRKKTEYVKGHIEGAVSILNTEMTEQDLQNVVRDKDAAILFYCNGVRCLRSTSAIRKAKSWGYTNLIWFRGGWKEWTEKKLPVVAD